MWCVKCVMCYNIIMKNIFTRSKFNPILVPDKGISNESKKDYNCGVVKHRGQYFLFYRAVGDKNISKIKLAISADGERFIKKDKIVIAPQMPNESRGVEDPRITKIEDKYVLTYTAYDGVSARLCMATSTDLESWEKHGEVFQDWDAQKAGYFTVPWDKAQQNSVAMRSWCKAGAVFSEKINGEYLMLFGDRDIRFARSKDLVNWKADQLPLIERRDSFFDSVHVEMGPPPIKTHDGWLVFYHGIDEKAVYRLGYVLLDLYIPEIIIKRSREAILEPSLFYEKNGDLDIEIVDGVVPEVVFCNGAVVENNSKLRIYYGAEDSVICTAVADIKSISNSI